MGFDRYYKKNLEQTKRKIKESVSFDDFVVQTINNIDEINRIANTLIKRLREWYELYNPEFSRKMTDHEKFVELIVAGKDTKQKDSMGSDLKKELTSQIDAWLKTEEVRIQQQLEEENSLESAALQRRMEIEAQRITEELLSAAGNNVDPEAIKMQIDARMAPIITQGSQELRGKMEQRGEELGEQM